MKEKELKAKLKEKLGKYGLLWFPPHVRYYKETDVFGVYDALFYNGVDLFLIQITTKSHLSHRRKKMNARFIGMKIPHNSQIYAWDDRIKTFFIENV
jgi:hypothetical protein